MKTVENFRNVDFQFSILIGSERMAEEEGCVPEVKRVLKHSSVRPHRLREKNKTHEQVALLPATETEDHQKTLANKKDLCVDVLRNGFAQAFVDLFYLAHRPDPTPDADGRLTNVEIQMTEDDMTFLQSTLTSAEKARRTGDTPQVVADYHCLATYFERQEDMKTCIFYHAKCLEIAQLTVDTPAQMEALGHLGQAHVVARDWRQAAAYHEQQLELGLMMSAAANPMSEETASANHQTEANQTSEEAAAANPETMMSLQAQVALSQVYPILASEAADDTEARVYYEKAQVAAQATGDPARMGKAQYELGKMYLKLGEPASAIAALEQFKALSEDSLDVEQEGVAALALAQAHEANGEPAVTIDCLHRYLQLAEKTENLVRQAEACAALARMFTRTQDLEQAVKMSERHYAVARTIVKHRLGSRSILDRARVHLGIARGNEKLREYLSAIHHDVPKLVKWKIQCQTLS